jgi:predicted deacylase
VRAPVTIGDFTIKAGTRRSLELPAANLYTHTSLTLPVHVVHGRTDGPVLFIFGALHGDEINGVEIIRRLLRKRSIGVLKGTLIAVPVVNVHGFINQSRYLPDRRDLNRSFPGSASGSIAARFAHLLQTQIVSKCTHGIDLHTAALHRDNMPQVRARLDKGEVERMAFAFGMPVVMNTPLLEGSLRAACHDAGVPIIVYEAGEALRFDEIAIRAGVRGVLAVMRELGMLTKTSRNRPVVKPRVANSSTWVRASISGIVRSATALGSQVSIGDVLGVISDPFGETEARIEATAAGIIIGRSNLPLVNEGEALFHIARFDKPEVVTERI